jgi:hypothetical protein
MPTTAHDALLAAMAPSSVFIRNASDYAALWSRPALRARFDVDRMLAEDHAGDEIFALPGVCPVCEAAVRFQVDRQFGARQASGLWIPNWRERLVCPQCGLSNRQRAVAATLMRADRHRRQSHGRPTDVYMQEQVTALYRAVSERLPGQCLGSEYLGAQLRSGTVVDGIRHENGEALSFESASFDVVVSNDVLEHVAEPVAVLREMARVLRRDGILLFTAPFFPKESANRVRATRLEQGSIEHRQAPVYHGNPVDPRGALVFTDFGWELLDQVRCAGFADVVALSYWSLESGHLAGSDLIFVGLK